MVFYSIPNENPTFIWSEKLHKNARIDKKGHHCASNSLMYLQNTETNFRFTTYNSAQTSPISAGFLVTLSMQLFKYCWKFGRIPASYNKE